MFKKVGGRSPEGILAIFEKLNERKRRGFGKNMEEEGIGNPVRLEELKEGRITDV